MHNNDSIHRLTKREISIVQLAGKEYTNKQIAGDLKISIRTVEKHKEGIRKKLGVLSIIGVIMCAMRHNILRSVTLSILTGMVPTDNIDVFFA